LGHPHELHQRHPDEEAVTVRVLVGDCRDILRTLPEQSVHCCVTSPPYFGLRDYGVAGQIGLEPTPDEFVAEMVAVFREVRRVLRDDGTLWLNLGDSYASSQKGSGGIGKSGLRNDGRDEQTRLRSADLSNAAAKFDVRRFDLDGACLKPKDLIGIPWRVAFALQADGWWLRSSIIWHKPNPMPESVRDRPTSAHENIFLLAKSERYFFDADAVKEADGGKPSGNGFVRDHRLSYGDRGQEEQWEPGGGRNIRNVWTVATQPFADAHFATFPPALIDPCIKAGCPVGGTVLDPFGGAGTTGLVADRLQRNAILCELNPEYAAMADRRIRNEAGMFASISVGAA
jgi:DNA modification methylase